MGESVSDYCYMGNVIGRLPIVKALGGVKL